jgi:hypothetical protein
MPNPFRRFELLLPTKFNSGLPVPNDAFADTLLELEERFGAVSSESQTIAGQWRHEGQVYRDESVRICGCTGYGGKPRVFHRLLRRPSRSVFSRSISG